MHIQPLLSEFVINNRSNLLKILTENHLNSLERVKTSTQLKELLLYTIYTEDRLIDCLTITNEELEKRYEDSEDYDSDEYDSEYDSDEDNSPDRQSEDSDSAARASSSVSSEAENEKLLNKLKKKLLELIVQNLDSTDWHEVIKTKKYRSDNLIGRYIKNSAEPEWLIDLIIRNLPNADSLKGILTQSVGDEMYANSIVTHTNIPFDKVIDFIQPFNDEEKMSIILAQTDDNNCLLYRADSEGKMSILIDSIENEELKSQLENQLYIINLRKRSTHFLGIADKGTEFDAETNLNYHDQSEDESKAMGFEGFDGFQAQSAFVNVLNPYQPSEAFLPEMCKIKDAFNRIDYYQSQTSQISEATKYYHDNDFIIIPSGWPGHTIVVAATDRFLVVANRGQGIHDLGGCIIYRLEKPLTDEDIKIFSRCGSQETIENQIRSIATKDNDEPIIFHAFPIKQQKYGTCAIANRKAVVAGILPLLRELREDKLKEPQFSEFLLTESNKEYKQFTHFTRSITLNELIEAFDSTPNQQEILMEGLSEYCNQHLDFSNPSEVKLLHQLIINIPGSLINEFFDKLSIEAKIILRYLYTEGIEKPIPIFIKELSEANSILQPEIFAELCNYLANYPGEFQELLEYKIDQRNIDETPLMLAVLAQNMQYIEKLLDENVDINKKLPLWPCKSALDLAILNRHTEVAKKLIDNNAKIKLLSLEYALKNELIDLVEIILTKKPTFIDHALQYSVEMKNINMIARILDFQPSPSQESKDHALINIGNSKEVAKLLINHGAKVNKTFAAFSPLMSAIQSGNIEVVDFLLSQGASVNSVTSVGTPLYLAGLYAKKDASHGGIIQLLLDNGADIDDSLSSDIQKICLMSDLMDSEPSNAYSRFIYLSADGKYVVRGEDGTVYEDSLPPDSGIDISNIENKLNDHDFKKAILKITSKRGHTTPATLLFRTIDNGYIDVARNLIMRGANLDSFVQGGETPLTVAAYNGHPQIITAIIEKDPTLVDSMNMKGESALHVAIHANKIVVVQELINLNANLNLQSLRTGETPLISAIISKQSDIANLLIDNGVNLDLRDKNDKSALFYAIENNNIELAKKLIDKGALTQSDDELVRACLFAAIKGGDDFNAIALMLIDKTEVKNIDLVDESGSTALLWAAQMGNIDIFSKLLEKGADIQHANNEGWNVIFYAANYDHIDMIEKIKANDPNFRSRLNHTDENTKTALYYIIDNEDPKIALKLLEEGADPNVIDEDGDTLLMYVRDPKLAKMLIINGTRVNHQNKLGITPLLSSINDGYNEIASILLDAGADPNIPDSNGETPLLHVKDPNLAQKLIENGADINHKNTLGISTLQLAICEANNAIVLLLMNAGANPDIIDPEGNSLLTRVDDPELLVKLIEKGADIHHINKNGRSVLNVFMQQGLVDLVLILIKHADQDKLFAELSEASTIYLLNKLPATKKQQVLNEIESKLTENQLSSLQSAYKPNARAKSVVFREHTRAKNKTRVEKLITGQAETIKRTKPLPKQ